MGPQLEIPPDHWCDQHDQEKEGGAPKVPASHITNEPKILQATCQAKVTELVAKQQSLILIVIEFARKQAFFVCLKK